METKRRVLIVFLILVFLVAVLYSVTEWVSKTTGFSINVPEENSSNCLNNSSNLSECSNVEKTENPRNKSKSLMTGFLGIEEKD